MSSKDADSGGVVWTSEGADIGVTSTPAGSRVSSQVSRKGTAHRKSSLGLSLAQFDKLAKELEKLGDKCTESGKVAIVSKEQEAALQKTIQAYKDQVRSELIFAL